MYNKITKVHKIYLNIFLLFCLAYCIIDLYSFYNNQQQNTNNEYCIEYIIQSNHLFREEQKDIEIFLETKKIEDKINELTEEEWECLYRVARAEAGAHSKEGQKNVVYVVLNRVNSDKFPNTIKEVVFQSKPAKQFVCVFDGNYDKVEISEFTMNNVKEAYLEYENDYIDGALFFTLYSFKNNTYLFTDEVGHNFYK